MPFIRQTTALVEKTLTIVLIRSWFGTLIRTLIAPVVFMFFISYAKNFFVPPSTFGIGSPTPLLSFDDALASSAGGRDTVAFVHNGLTGGAISNVIDQMSQTVHAQGKSVDLLNSDASLLSTCKSSIRGVTTCFAAVSFYSSPDEGPGGNWNYTIWADGSFGEQIYVDRQTNDAQVYVLPLQHAVDNTIASLNQTSLPGNVQQYPYTSQTAAQRTQSITRLYMGSLINILAVAYFVGIVGICYELTGQMARERELGMSQLIEAMMPNRRRWEPQVARLLSVHLSYDLLYFPGWVISGVIIARQNYPTSNVGILVGFFILAGLSLSSWSVAFASLFRKAQLSGITVTIVSIVLAIIIQVVTPRSTGSAAILCLLFPPMNYTLFIIYMAYWEQQGLGADLRHAPPMAHWRLPGYVFFIFCIIHLFVFPVVGALIERALYSAATKARNLRYEETDSTEAMKISGLAKHYPPGWFYRKVVSRFSKSRKETVRAVDSIDLSVLRGQIMVLLGANGSGKSTTLDMLAGLQRPSAGQIEMDASGGIGLCPQKNVLWDELTVYEHVKIFNRLKATQPDSKAALTELVAACDLDIKLNARSGTLSGGQKRKCQLAMMLTGGSSICMLDEVSSGLDPLSRRKIWDILLAERGKRSMLLTTHFLDEADLLSDDIAILSKGKMVANGSAVALKHRLGGGYRVRIYHENKKELPAELEAVSKQVFHDQTVYSIADSTAAARFISHLERVGVRDYQVNGPTIEDVFLRLAEEVKDELEDDRGPGSDVSSTEDVVPAEKDLRLVEGKNLSFVRQSWVLFRKRSIILWHNPLPYLAVLLIPIITAGLVTLFLKGFQPLSCSPELNVVPSQAPGLDNWLGFNATIPFGPPDQVSLANLNRLYPLLNPPPFRNTTTLQAMEDFISVHYNRTRPGGFFLGDVPTFAWRGNYDLYYSVAAQNLLDNSLLRNVPIVTSYNTFAIPWGADTGKSLQFILYFGLAMSAVPGFFGLYPNVERSRKVRALHYSNGVRAGPLWLAYTIFDFLIILVASAITIIIFRAASDVWYGLGYVFVILALFGLSATLMSYVVSLFASSQLATFAFAAGGQCVFFLIYFIAYLCIITYIPAANVDADVLIAHYTIALFFPAGNLLRALLLTFNEFSLLCRGTETAPYPGAFDVYGSSILYLIIQSAVMLTMLIWYDSGWKPGFLTRTKFKAEDDEAKEEVDSEVFEEAERVDASNDALRVKHVTKVFGANTAVKDVSFGVPIGETFALLGPNGAGKSTTIGLIRADTRPTGGYGDILIEDKSIIAHRATARAHLGVCPQFDAMDQMTAIEHLRFYARARGVADVEHNVEQVIRAVGLTPFKSRMASKLSGGNKRKLSLGIALMGNPSVLLLDEPSSGMDAASKRVMWRTLRAVSSGRSLVLTTHSMEEADALADRAGIMARRMLALGTSDQLRKKHGDAYHVHLVHRDAPYTAQADMDVIKAFINRTFPGAETEDRVFHGQLRFSVPNDRTLLRDSPAAADDDGGASSRDAKGAVSTVSPAAHGDGGGSGIAALFSELEANKDKLGLEYYSVSQATLDQVFLNIVSKHNVQEENYAKAHPKKRSAFSRFRGKRGADL